MTNSTDTAPTSQRTLKTWPFNLALMRHSPGAFTFHSLFHILFLVAPVALGLIDKAVFDRLSGATSAGWDIWTLVALYISIGVARLAASFADVWGAVTFRRQVGGLLRHNMLASLLRRPGALPFPVTSGEAISRYRNDVAEVADFPTWLPHVAGTALTALLAIVIMAQINLLITLVIFLPLVGVVFVARFFWARFMVAQERERQGEDQVTGFLGELFGAVQAVKIAGAERDVVAHFAELNQARGRAATHVHVLWDLLYSFSDLTAQLAIGVMLLLAGSAMSAGTFSVGDFALFIYYLWFATELPTLFGSFLGDYNQQAVSIKRLVELVPDEAPVALVSPIGSQETRDSRQETSRQADQEISNFGHLAIGSSGHRGIAPLHHHPTPPLLTARGLTYRYPTSGRGLMAAELRLARGSFTVITGRIGSGKTTLLRVLLGLLPHEAGEIAWNGQPISDPARWFVPPQAAYTPQVPRLFSETLRENILLGQPASNSELAAALHAAVLEPDLALLENGLETLVGPRGVRLSGGQVQRAAAARMLVRTPALLVCDDLSSALDVETEQLLWARLRQGSGIRDRGSETQRSRSLIPDPRPLTVLAVSHRRAVLRQADQVILLNNGHVAATGSLDVLLETSAEMRRLWAEEVQNEPDTNE